MARFREVGCLWKSHFWSLYNRVIIIYLRRRLWGYSGGVCIQAVGIWLIHYHVKQRVLLYRRTVYSILPSHLCHFVYHLGSFCSSNIENNCPYIYMYVVVKSTRDYVGYEIVFWCARWVRDLDKTRQDTSGYHIIMSCIRRRNGSFHSLHINSSSTYSTNHLTLRVIREHAITHLEMRSIKDCNMRGGSTFGPV